jgi:hypothetical protein
MKSQYSRVSVLKIRRLDYFGGRTSVHQFPILSIIPRALGAHPLPLPGYTFPLSLTSLLQESTWIYALTEGSEKNRLHSQKMGDMLHFASDYLCFFG